MNVKLRIATLLLMSATALTQNTKYYFCANVSNYNMTTYYSKIFSTDAGKSAEIANAFDTYVLETYHPGGTFNHSVCWQHDSYDDATANKDQNINRDMSRYKIVETGWQY